MKFKAALQEDFALEVLKAVFVWPVLHDTTPMRLPWRNGLSIFTGRLPLITF